MPSSLFLGPCPTEHAGHAAVIPFMTRVLVQRILNVCQGKRRSPGSRPRRRICGRELIVDRVSVHACTAFDQVQVLAGSSEVPFVGETDRVDVAFSPLKAPQLAPRIARRLRESGFHVFVRHDLFDCAELGAAAGVVEVLVRVDDHGDRLVGHRSKMFEDLALVPRRLRVDHHDAAVGDEERGVAAPAPAVEHVQVVFELFELEGRLRGVAPRCAATTMDNTPPMMSTVRMQALRMQLLHIDSASGGLVARELPDEGVAQIVEYTKSLSQ